MSTPALKRKRNDDNNYPDIETAQTTSETGLKLVAQLKRSQDKNGRDIAGHFLDLPSADEYPDYYQQIAMPITLDMIETKLDKFQYTTMDALEGDLKRMVQNAKDYNDSRSEVFLDAERIRKALSNFMPRHNPSYSDPDYRAVATPIPQAMLDRMRESSVSTNATGGAERVKLVFKQRQSVPVSTPGADEDPTDRYMELLEELSIQPDAVNFEKKPPKRDYPDYYKMIDRPTSISDVKTMIRQGKITDWDHLAKEVRLVWDNAKTYNEEGSPIYEMTEALETWFEDQVQAAGAGPRPKAPRLSLSQPRRTQLRLKMATPSTFSSGTVDSESLRRQKEEIAQAVDRANRGSSRGVISTPGPPSSTAPSLTRSLSSVEPNGDIIMAGTNGSHADPRTSIPPRQLPTPVMNGVPPTSSLVNGNRHPDQVFAPPRNLYSESDNPLERKFRDPGKGLKDALILSVEYMTHPNLPGDPKWRLKRHASESKTQTSSYIFLPADHFYLRLIPSLSNEFWSRPKRKVAVSCNWQSVPASPHVAERVYDFRLQPGENTIVVDALAELKEGERKDYAPPQMQLDFERIQLVVVLVERSTE